MPTPALKRPPKDRKVKLPDYDVAEIRKKAAALHVARGHLDSAM